MSICKLFQPNFRDILRALTKNLTMCINMILVFVLLAVSVNGHTKNCCTPAQWESINSVSYVTVDTTGSKKPVYTSGVEAVSVDQTNHKIASLTTLSTAGFKVNVQVIQLFDKRIMYTIQSGECKPSDLPAWTPNCVPDNATKVQTTYYGAGDNKVNFDTYTYSAPTGNYSIGMTTSDCAPLFVSGYGSAGGVSSISMKQYANVTLGIKDTSVFDVPDICTNVTMYDSPVPMANW